MCDPRFLALYKPFGNSAGNCIGYSAFPVGHPEYTDNHVKLAQFVTIGVVSVSRVLQVPKGRRSKFMRAFLPGHTSDRLQGLVRVGMRSMKNPVHTQISTMGYEFATRVKSDQSVPSSPTKTSRREKRPISRARTVTTSTYALGFDEESEHLRMHIVTDFETHLSSS